MRLLKNFAEAFYPSDIKCIVCDAELNKTTRYMLCDDCKLNYNSVFCSSCGRSINGESDVCDECYENNNIFTMARSSFVFGGEISHLVYKLKYKNARYLAETMAHFMVDTYYEADWDIDSVTFVPLHKKRFEERGYNQSELIAKEICKIIGLPCVDLIDKIVYTKNMAKLNREQRAECISDTFCLKANADIKGKNILLIDDVLTTGATSNECAKQLKLLSNDVYVLTFASVKNKQRLIYNNDNTSNTRLKNFKNGKNT